MNLSFNVLLAPYRLDFFNYLYKHYNCAIYFEQKGFIGQLFSSDKLVKECLYQPQYLKTKKIGHRNWVTNITSIIKKHNPNTIFVSEFSLTTIQVILYKFLYRKSFKIVSICDDSYDILQGNGFSKMHHYARKLLMPFINEIILVDKKAVDWYQRKYHKGIWMPIIRDENKLLPIFQSVAQKAQKINEQYKGKKILLFVGRLIDVKNIPLLFQAYKVVQKDYELCIVGDGEKKKELQQLCTDLQINVHFIGQQEGENLYCWYKAADIFVLPSYKEAFGAVVNEALLAGCNCIVSEHAGSSCLIHNGVNGYIFNPYSTEDLVQCIKKCETNLSNTTTSKMTVSFVERMDNLIQQLNNLSNK